MIRGSMGAAVLALGCTMAQSAQAGEFDAITSYIPADSVWVLGIDTGALRESPAAQQILEGIRPADLFEPLRAFVADGLGAGAIPAATVLIASPSFAHDTTDLLVAVVFDAAQPSLRDAARARVADWTIVAAEAEAESSPIYTRNGFAFAFPDESTALLGNLLRVEDALERRASAAPGPVAAGLSFDDQRGAVVLRAVAPSTVSVPVGLWAEWLTGVTANLSVDDSAVVRVQLVCAPPHQEAAASELTAGLGAALASPQLAALLPGPPPTVTFERSEAALTIRFALARETWDALVRSAAAAVESEYR